MSFEVYLQAFADGAEAGIDPAAIRHAFAGFLFEEEEDYWRVQYDADDGCNLFLQPLAADPMRVHCLSIRTCADLRLWHAVHELLAIPGTLLHFPGGAAPLARDPAIAIAMPATLLAALGRPVPVADAAALRAAVEGV